VGAVGTAIVTGSCGFIGARIAALMAEAGYRVVGVDRSVEAAPEGIVQRQLTLPDDTLDDILLAEKPDVVIHAAGPASVGDSVLHPLEDFEGSVRVHAHMLDAVRRCAPRARVIALSSAAVYGNPESLPIGEDVPSAPISPYGHHKVMCEGLLREYASVYGMNTCALRVFSAYGAGLKRQLLWDVCEKAASNPVVRLFGTGDETRDYVHVDDIARAVRVVTESSSVGFTVYNVASGVETSVREVATALVEVVAPGKAVEFSGEVRAGDPLRWRADISRIRSLGFEPARRLSDGVEDYAAWYRDVMRP